MSCDWQRDLSFVAGWKIVSLGITILPWAVWFIRRFPLRSRIWTVAMLIVHWTGTAAVLFTRNHSHLPPLPYSENQDMEASTIQVPEMTLLWNRTTPAEVQVISHELSLGLIKTDNIDVWGKVTSSAYPTNRDKIWQLSVPQPGCSMLIYFHEFDIERSQNCKQDYFSVQIRKRQSNIPRYCNTLSRIELGRTRRVQLWIHSGNSTSRRGLYAMYCFSHWPLGPADLPCSCNGRTHHKAQRSINTTASSGTWSIASCYNPIIRQ